LNPVLKEKKVMQLTSMLTHCSGLFLPPACNQKVIIHRYNLLSAIQPAQAIRFVSYSAASCIAERCFSGRFINPNLITESTI